MLSLPSFLVFSFPPVIFVPAFMNLKWRQNRLRFFDRRYCSIGVDGWVGGEGVKSYLCSELRETVRDGWVNE